MAMNQGYLLKVGKELELLKFDTNAVKNQLSGQNRKYVDGQ